jgi:hypothetical protein
MLPEKNAPEVQLDGGGVPAALQYMRQRYDDFVIAEARFVDMIRPLSGSPLD